MTFDEAEEQFRALNEEIRQGASISRADFERQVSHLAVVDARGRLWQIHPGKRQWVCFDGRDWISAVPPGRRRADIGSDADIGGSSPRDVSTPDNNTPRRRASASQKAPSPARSSDRVATDATSRDWVPLAIGIVAFAVASFILIFGGHAILGFLAPSVRPIQVQVAQPTFTPLPAQSDAPTLPLPTETVSLVVATVIEPRVNVRAAPSTQAEIKGKILKGARVFLEARTADGQWYRVSIVDIPKPAWVFAETLQVSSGDPNQLPVSGQ
ncbi:MAG: SH3 domain-containing protein [Chloroflexi bacterium]|nr:SH3 domain-containing protein [Chloroflexota bacterium]